MKERPIIFSGSMVLAILEGRKTQTRRVITPQPAKTMTDAVAYLNGEEWCFTGPQRDSDGQPLPVEQWDGGWPECTPAFRCPYGVLGDRLWVRETFCCVHGIPGSADPHRDDFVQYRADGEIDGIKGTWRPPIFMPRVYSRITLEITQVRVQRLQHITCPDLMEEGSPCCYREYSDGSTSCVAATQWFKKLWDSINEKRGFGWNTNAWVWAITFRRVNSSSAASVSRPSDQTSDRTEGSPCGHPASASALTAG